MKIKYNRKKPYNKNRGAFLFVFYRVPIIKILEVVKNLSINYHNNQQKNMTNFRKAYNLLTDLWQVVAKNLQNLYKLEV